METSTSSAGGLNVEDRIVAAIRRVIRAVDLHSRHLVTEYGLTGPQLATLQEAARLGPISASALARAVHISTPTLTGIVNRLELRGFVRRERSSTDRRTVTILVTEVGRKVLGLAPSLLQNRFRVALSRLEEWEQLMMLANLQRIASMMDAETLDAAPHLISDSDELSPETTAPEPLPPPVQRRPGPDGLRNKNGS